MTISLTLNNKNTITPTLETKGPNTTWDEATYTWDQAEGTWDKPGTVVETEAKNTVTITNEAKT